MPRSSSSETRPTGAAGSYRTNNAKTDYSLAASFDAGWHAADP